MGLFQTLNRPKKIKPKRRKRYEPCLRKAVLNKLIRNSSLLGSGKPGENKARENDNDEARRISQRLARLRNIFRNRRRPLETNFNDNDNDDDFDYGPPTRRRRKISYRPPTPGQSPRSRLRRQHIFDPHDAGNVNQYQPREWNGRRIIDSNPQTPQTPTLAHTPQSPQIIINNPTQQPVVEQQSSQQRTPPNTIIIDQTTQPQNNLQASLASTPQSINEQQINQPLPGSTIIRIENDSQGQQGLRNGELPFERIASEVIPMSSGSEPDSSLEMLSYKDAPPGVIPLRDIKIERGIKREPISPQQSQSNNIQIIPTGAAGPTVTINNNSPLEEPQVWHDGPVETDQYGIPIVAGPSGVQLPPYGPDPRGQPPAYTSPAPEYNSQGAQNALNRSSGSQIIITSGHETPINSPPPDYSKIAPKVDPEWKKNSSSASNTSSIASRHSPYRLRRINGRIVNSNEDHSSLERRRRRNGPPIAQGNRRGIQMRRARVFRNETDNPVERIPSNRERSSRSSGHNADNDDDDSLNLSYYRKKLLDRKRRKLRRQINNNLTSDNEDDDEELPLPTQKYNKNSSSSFNRTSSTRATSPTQLLDTEHLNRTTQPTTQIRIQAEPASPPRPEPTGPIFNVRENLNQWLQNRRRLAAPAPAPTAPVLPPPVAGPSTTTIISPSASNGPDFEPQVIVHRVPVPAQQQQQHGKKRRIRAKPVPGHTFYNSKFIKTLPNISPETREKLQTYAIPRRKKFLQQYYRDKQIVEPPQMNSPADQGRQFNPPPRIPRIDLNEDELADIANYQTSAEQQQQSQPKITIQPQPGSGQPKITVQPQTTPTQPISQQQQQQAFATGHDSLDEMLDREQTRFREEARLKAEQRRILDEYCESAKSTSDLQQLNRNYLQCIAETVNAFYN